MRTFMINELKVGEDHILSNALSAYAADVPGMAHIGMGNSPNFILGMDVLRKDKMLLDPGKYKMYMSK
jgi:hypothetical protein